VVRFASVGVLVMWGGAVAFGFASMSRFESTPGPASVAPATWPAESAVPLDGGRPALVMFVHPRCACTRASLHELERLLVHAEELETWVVVAGDGPSENRTKAEAIPGVRVLVDPSGTEALRFGSHTSGHVVVYSAEGDLRFSGGITGGRGHEGDNLGSAAALTAALARPTAPTSPVFGCTLKDSE
jgi:hypothetical protein